MLDLLLSEIKNGIPLERIAFLSHTISARLEAKKRVQSIITITNEKDQLRYFRTIHGICYMENSLSRDNVMQPKDYLDFAKSIGIAFSVNFTADCDMDGLPIGFNISGGNEILATRQFAAAQCKLVSEVKDHWPNWIAPNLMKEAIVGFEDWKKQKSKFDFVDMLFLYRDYGEALDIDVLFIDEAQDLSKLQWQIVLKMMPKAKRVYIAGDDDQSIYAFIGADRYGFLDHKCDKTEILPKTWRLKQNVWDFAQKIISPITKRQVKDITTQGEGGHISYFNSNILYLPLNPKKTTMIIARHHKILQNLAQSLELRGIPFKGKGKEIHGGEQTRAVHAYFRARNGENISLRDAAMMLKFIGNAEGVKELRREARDNPALCISKEQLKKRFKVDWGRNWVTYIARYNTEITKNEIIRNILNTAGLPGIIDEPNIVLSTYHGCKGREADEVILLTDCYRKAYEYSNLYPDDERRLAYVGVTRAKEKLTIVAPDTDMWIRSLI
jgi:DNA helicase-2/ATP-dependent DNA helicase PcrA